MPIQIRLGKSRMDATSLNLSDHGMYMFTAANLPLGSELEIVFRSPGENSLILASAVVRRKVVYLYGIEFLSKSDHHADQDSFPLCEDTPVHSNTHSTQDS